MSRASSTMDVERCLGALGIGAAQLSATQLTSCVTDYANCFQPVPVGASLHRLRRRHFALNIHLTIL